MNIIITGAGKGIGFETSLELLKDKSNHVIAISRNKESLARLQQESQKQQLPGKVSVHPFDLENFAPEHIASLLGDPVDVLINNAGLLINKPFEKLSDEEWKKMYEVNVFAPVKLIRCLLPQFNKEKSHIINISSMGAVQGSSKFKGLSAYSSGKAALAAVAECLAVELKEKNISVNCLALGAVQTEMFAEAFPGYEAPVKASEMAKFISHFALNGHHYFNGKIIPVALSNP